MSVKKIFLIAAMAVAVCACEKDNRTEGYVPEEGEIQLQMIYPEATTRVTGNRFDSDDKIGVYVASASVGLPDSALQLAGNVVNNELFTYNGSSWTSSRGVYWDEGLHHIYAYYPYSESVNDVVDYSFCVQLDQSSGKAYEESDFLWARMPNIPAKSDPVSMLFAHKLSKAIVNLEKGDTFTGDIPADAEVYIMSTVPNAVIDLATGDAAKDNFAATQSIKCKKVDTGKYTAIVVPQSITSRRPLVEVVIGSVSYLMEGKISFRQGYSHTITVTLNQNPDQVKIEIGGSTSGWE